MYKQYITTYQLAEAYREYKFRFTLGHVPHAQLIELTGH